MQKVILNLVIHSFGVDNFSKAETALQTLRIDCVTKDPSVYNDWVVQFRDSLFERGRKAFWDILVEGKCYLQGWRNFLICLCHDGGPGVANCRVIRNGHLKY
jgi:hypothetical protein